MRRRATELLAAALLVAAACVAASAKDRVLLIGIDEYRSHHVQDIEGCENDALLLREFLKEKLGFRDSDVRLLLNEQATEAGIRAAVQRWLVDGTQPGDRVFLSYSGHGTRVPDLSGDEDRDGMDEALAAHDVVPREPVRPGEPVVPAGGYITDDEVSRWIASLHGRQVVMLFDSCHSGTISRGVGGKAQHESRFLRFRGDGRGAGRQDVYSPDYNRSAQSRDLSVVTEGFLDKTVNGVVVVSAARADQEAFPVYAHRYGRKQGALTYLFVEKQLGGLVPVEGLQAALGEGMEELKRAALLSRGRNGEYQSPQVEIYLRQQAALPIFGGAAGSSWTAAPQVALHNPLSRAAVEIWTADGRRDYSITKRIGGGRVGEVIPLKVRTSAAGYLYLWVFSRGAAGGVAKCLFPWRRDRNNYVRPGTYSFPRCAGGGEDCAPAEMYEYFASEPVGQDVWVALVTDKPLELREDDYEYTWAEAFRHIGLEKVQAALSGYAATATTRGGGVRPVQRPTVSDWQAGVVVLNAVR